MTTNYRDGQRHQVGPITLQFTGLTQWGPSGIATIAAREGVNFKLDWLIAEAIAHTIAATADLWTAKENSPKWQPETGETRGNLRIDLTSDLAKLGNLTGWADKHFFMSRLVTGAGPGQKAVPILGYRTVYYHRAGLKLIGGYAPQDSRREFIELAGIFARSRYPELPPDWEASMMARFDAADAIHKEIAAQRREIEDEDNTATITDEAAQGRRPGAPL